VPWSRKSRAIPLLSLWAVRPVQSISACTRVHLTCLHVSMKECKNGSCKTDSDYLNEYPNMFRFRNVNIVLVSASGHGKLAGICECGTAPSGSVIRKEFLE